MAAESLSPASVIWTVRLEPHIPGHSGLPLFRKVVSLTFILQVLPRPPLRLRRRRRMTSKYDTQTGWSTYGSVVQGA